MAIESAVMFRRIARTACLVVIVGLLVGGPAWPQLPITASAPVSAGSVIPFNHGLSGTWNQIYSMKIAPNGTIAFLDSANSAIYQLAPGASVPTLVVGAEEKGTPSDCSLLEYSSSYWNAAIAFDQWNNMYVTDRYGSSVNFCRVPYDPSAGSWDFSNTAIWNTPTYTLGGTSGAIRPQDIQVGDDGSFYVSTSSAMSPSIFKFKVDQSGNVSGMTTLATGLKDMVSNLAVDHAGNVYFIENAYDQPSKKVPGILEIPAGSATVQGDGTGSADGALPRLDSGWNGVKGLTFDAHGNLYFTSENNTSYGGQVDGVFMVPNENTPTNPHLVWADLIRVAPVSSGFPVLIDPRGMIWIATGGSSNWGPPGTNAGPCGAGIPISNCTASTVVLWKPGSANVGSSPVGTGTTQITGFSAGGTAANPVLTLTATNSFSPGDVVTISASTGDALAPLDGKSFYVLGGSGLSSTQFPIVSSALSGSGTSSATAKSTFALYYSFARETTPAAIAVAKPADSSFMLVPNPVNNTTTTPPVTPCTAGTTYPGAGPLETQAGSYSWCGVYVQLNTSTAGSVEGELQLLDASNNVIEGSNVYLSGIGMGPAVSMVSSSAIQAIASGLSHPGQVAADVSGNSYVADSALKAIEMYKAGATPPSVGTAIGTGLTAPTGVAVDRAGNLYIGDSGGIIEIPFVNGKLTSQTTLITGLGSHLNLAADASGNLFVADKDNKRVVELPNPHTALLLDGQPLLTLGTSAGFAGPTAVATDSAGNVWVADSGNLWEITMPFGVASQVVKGLPAPITGLAVDPSGSVFVSNASGVTWIPFNPATGSLNTNAEVLVTPGLGSNNGSAPIGVALDGAEDLFVTYGTGASAGLAQIGIGGTLDFNTFGEINPNVPFEADTQVFNLGNTALTLSAFSGDVASDPQFTAGPATENAPACGPATNTLPGGYCYLGLTVTAATAGTFSANMPVLSNAANAMAGVNVALTATAVTDLRPASSTSLVITPASGVIYPGTEQVTVTVGSESGTPSGNVTLSVSSSNGILPKQTQALDASGTATFSYTNLLGGSYNVNALYGGTGTAGSTQNSCSGGACFAGSASRGSFVILPAQPTVTVGPPGNVNCMAWGTASSDSCTVSTKNVTSWTGSTYVSVGGKLYLTAQVDSSVGTPTGTVIFCSAYANGKCTPADATQGVNGALPLNPDPGSGKLRVSFSTANLAVGVYNLIAVYSGDVNYASQAIKMPTFNVIGPSIQVTSTPATATITPGKPVTIALSLMPLVGFSGDVSLACSTPTLPKYTQCTFAYPNSSEGTVSVGVSSPTASTIQVTISSNVPVNGGATTTSSIARQAPWALAGLFGLGLLGLIAGRRRVNRYLTMLCIALMFSGVLMSIPACTNAGYSTPPPAPKVSTPSGTYNVVIYSYNPNSGQQNSLAAPFTPYTLPATVQ